MEYNNWTAFHFSLRKAIITRGRSGFEQTAQVIVEKINLAHCIYELKRPPPLVAPSSSNASLRAATSSRLGNCRLPDADADAEADANANAGRGGVEGAKANPLPDWLPGTSDVSFLPDPGNCNASQGYMHHER
jgi:hypothetical protein